MNRNLFWKFLFVLFVVGWAVYEVTPPAGKDLIKHFQARARAVDQTFSNIVEAAREAQVAAPERPYGNLLEAVGTNDITSYFPDIDVSGEREPSRAVLHQLQQEAAGQIRLGLDLQGGISFLVQMNTNELERTDEKQAALANAVEVLRSRVDSLGVAEPLLQPQGSDRILIQMPGLSQADREQAMTTIEKAAFLEFRMVHPSNRVYLASGLVPPGYEVLRTKQKNDAGQEVLVPYLVKKKAERGLTGKYLNRAYVTRAEFTNEPEIGFDLNEEGARIFAEITREFQPQGDQFFSLAIVLDGELYSAPVIQGPIEGGRGRITGSFDFEEARTLANVLQNPLEAPVQIIEERTVSPSLGEDSIRSGVRAMIIGLVLVAGFMLVYYLFCGLLANIALLLNIVILMGVLCSIDATLTLPGIAGIVLTYRTGSNRNRSTAIVVTRSVHSLSHFCGMSALQA